MKCKFCLIVLLGVIFINFADAQVSDSGVYVHPIHTESVGNSGTGSNINVVYHRCEWTADPNDATETLTGKVTTYFKTLVNNVNTLTFDFNKTSFNNANLKAFYGGNACSISYTQIGTNTNIVLITLPTAIALANTLDSVTISYKGTPPIPSGNALGWDVKQDNNGNNYIYTLSESYEDRNWWPCKADMQDKIDSIDIIVTCPNSFWVASNGVMVDSSDDGTNRRFEFKHRYPIASYLVAIGIAKYKRLYLGNIATASTTVPYVINIFEGKTTTEESNIMIRLHNNKLVMQALSNVWGEYPFAKEKHGYYEFGFSGGMEHQTMSGMGTNTLTSNTILAHELGHQWWGDKVTMSTWNHLWLAEGFATLSETIAFEMVPSIGINTINKMASIKSQARSIAATPVFINNITSSNTIWTNNNTTAIYQKGCMVASQLRCLLGDTKFFAACKNYLNDTLLKYKSATTADLQRNMEAVFGENMTDYFDEWINKTGTPDYNIEWANIGNKITFSLAQTVDNGGNVTMGSGFLPMPIVIRISNANQDTTVVIYHKAPNVVAYAGDGIGNKINSNVISYNLSFIPDNVSFDPLNRTMANATVTYNAILPIFNIDILAKKFNNKNEIKVTIITDDNIDKAELERSENGKTFEAVGKMNVLNSSVTTQAYQAFDENSNSKKVYYRAKVYINGKITYSKIVVIENKLLGFSISPNPAKDFVTIKLDKFFENSQLTVTDILGKQVLQQKISSNNTIVNFNFPKGVYVANVFLGNEILSEKFVVE